MHFKALGACVKVGLTPYKKEFPWRLCHSMTAAIWPWGIAKRKLTVPAAWQSPVLEAGLAFMGGRGLTNSVEGARLMDIVT